MTLTIHDDASMKSDVEALVRRMDIPDDVSERIVDFAFDVCVRCAKCQRELLRLERRPLLCAGEFCVGSFTAVVRNGYLVVDERIALRELGPNDQGYDALEWEGRRYETRPEVYVMLLPFTRLGGDIAVCDDCRIRVMRRSRRAFARWHANALTGIARD